MNSAGVPSLLELFGVPKPQPGVVPAAALVHRADRPAVLRALAGVLAAREAATISFRLAVDERRWLRLTAEPVPDGNGGVPAVRGTVQDTTDQRTEQARRHRVEEALASYRQHREAEQAVAEAFQQALLPTSGELAASELLDVRAACQALQRSNRVGGVMVRPDPSGPTALRARGGRDPRRGPGEHGRRGPAVQRDPRLRVAGPVSGSHPQRAQHHAHRAAAGARPGDQRVGRLRPRAGPGLLRDGRPLATAAATRPRPGLCCGPMGPPLGEDTLHRYAEQTVEVRRGDLVLLHTDGLVVRRKGDSAPGLDLLLDAAPQVDLADPEAVVGYLSDKLGQSPDDDLCVIVGRTPADASGCAGAACYS